MKTEKEYQNEYNQKINEYNQQNKLKKNKKIPKFKKLFKQIGASTKDNFKVEVINSNDELINVINDFINQRNNYKDKIRSILKEILEENDVWIHKNKFTWFSNKFFMNWNLLNEKGIELNYFSKKDGEVKIPKYINLGVFKSILNELDGEDLFKEEYEEQRENNEGNWELFKRVFNNHFNEVFKEEEELKGELEGILENFDKEDQEHKDILKDFLDKNLQILYILKNFNAKDEEIIEFGDKGHIYNEIDDVLINYNINNQYNKIRNYMTKKPYSLDKIRLYFNNSTLLNGWDKNKEKDNLSVLLKDGNDYYITIMNKKNNNFFDELKNPDIYEIDDDEVIYKMDYKLIPGPAKFFAKCLMPNKDRKKYGATDEILDLYDKGKYKKNENFDKNSLWKLIDFYKKGVKKYEKWSIFDFNFKPTEEYEDIDQFYSDVKKQGYKKDWKAINKSKLMKAVDEGKIYLFKISTKDTSKNNKKSRSDLEKIYWDAIFDENSNVKLNGNARIFFRESSINKELKKLKKHNDNAIINKRFTEDKIFFQCPITLNYFSGDNENTYSLNEKVKDYIKKNDDIHVIGIDRGEKHLAYYSVINKEGDIVKQGTLNIINGIDYEKKLAERANERNNAKISWDTVSKIRDLKNGYVSQCIRSIVDLILQYNGIVVLEDLNSGFKNNRKKVEKSIYQNFELALAKKLSFLVLKDRDNQDIGGVNNPYQLCPRVNNFSDITSPQFGIMFYTTPSYTSITDPVSGFRKNLQLVNRGDNMREQMKFKEIGFDKNKNEYYFYYNPTDFKGNNSISTNWTIWSGVDRFRRIKKEGKHCQYNPTEELNKLFNKYEININKEISQQFKDIEEKRFYKDLIWIINLILQLRNNDGKNDFILSPVEVNGKKFDSREYLKQLPEGADEIENNISMPISGDANGAYNIARKGLLMINNIRNNVMTNGSSKNYKLFISNKDWDEFVQK